MGFTPKKSLIPSLVEHESCISLKHSKCWNPKSRLKSAREEGAGLGQLTRAYNPDGSLRFDALSDLRRKYRLDLHELSWDNIYTRPDLQIRALVLMSRDNYSIFNGTQEPLAFADAAYNGGAGGVRRDMRACGLAKSCDPQRWFGHVELYCTKSRAILYGNRSACDINRYHVTDVLKIRSTKYEVFFKE